MTFHQELQKKNFYLVSVDILQGLSVFIMVIGHTGLWWDSNLDLNWPNVSFWPWLLFEIALIVPAGFMFWYGFNVTNSLLRRKEKKARLDSRSRLLKRTVIFFAFAAIMEFITAVTVFPELVLNYILTWELFHMFAFSTFFLLLIFELAWMIEARYKLNYKKVCNFSFLISLTLIITFFLVFHDYSQSTPMEYYVDLNISSILKYAVFEKGQSPIIPFLAFTLSGGFLATYFDLPNESKEQILKKGVIISIISILIFLIGVLLLEKEAYVSPPVLYPASSPMVFIAIGFHLFSTTGLIFLLDLNIGTLRKKMNGLIVPFVLLSKITLTIYIIHNLVFVIPSKHPFIQLIFPNINLALVGGFFYTLFFIIVAFYWQKWDFKYTFEWIVLKLQNKKWVKKDYSI